MNISKKNRTIPTKLVHQNTEITDPKKMAEAYNDFFVNIGNMVEQKIPNSNVNFSSYLKDSVPNSIFLLLVNDNEVLNVATTQLV